MASNAATGFEEDADSQTEAAEAGESRQKTVRERALSSINKLMIQGILLYCRQLPSLYIVHNV